MEQFVAEGRNEQHFSLASTARGNPARIQTRHNHRVMWIPSSASQNATNTVKPILKRAQHVLRHEPHGRELSGAVFGPELTRCMYDSYPQHTIWNFPMWSEALLDLSYMENLSKIDRYKVTVALPRIDSNMSCPVCATTRVMVQTVRNCLEVPQLQFLRGCGRRCVSNDNFPAVPGGASDELIDKMFNV